jgi:hypothetical protein
MPTLSASDYTQYLKFKAAAVSTIRPEIQTRTQVAPLQSIVNANVLTTQAAFVVTPRVTNIVGNARVQAVQPMKTNNPNALSTVTYGGVGPTSSKVQQPGGLPTGFKSGMNTYTRPAQHAGWGSGANKS